MCFAMTLLHEFMIIILYQGKLTPQVASETLNELLVWERVVNIGLGTSQCVCTITSITLPRPKPSFSLHGESSSVPKHTYSMILCIILYTKVKVLEP